MNARFPLPYKTFTEASERFHALFAGSKRAHGVFPISAATRTEVGKVKCFGRQQPRTVKTGGATLDLWTRHLSGEQSLGVIPLCDNGTCVWGAIDVDAFDDRALAGNLATAIERLSFPLVVCRSKSGGAHLFLFLTEPAPAEDVIAALASMATRLGHAKAEIFPKQTKLDDPDMVGNWLNMPFFGGDATSRSGVKPGGMEMLANEFLDFAEAARVPAAALSALTTPAPTVRRQERTAAGLHTLAKAREWLADAARRLLAVPRGESKGNNTLNGMLHDAGLWGAAAGLTEEEVEEALLPNWSNSGRTLSDFRKCFPRSFCAGLAKGKAGVLPDATWRRGNDSGRPDRYPVFERIVRLIDDEESTCEVFLLSFSKPVVVTARTMSRNNLFNEACLTQLGVLFREMKKDDWADRVTEAMRTAEVRKLPPDETPEGEFFNLLEEFCTNRHSGTDRECLLTGQPWNDDETDLYVFRFADFRRFLNTHINASFRGETITKLGRRLAKIRSGDGRGVEDSSRSVNGKTVPVKCVRRSIFTPMPEPTLPPLPKDYL